MATITISGPALARDYGQVDPETGQLGARVTNPAVLATLNGRRFDDEDMVFSAYLGDGGDQTLVDAGVTGGILRFEYCGRGEYLTAVTEYEAPRLLTEAELLLLKDYTLGQWIDGIGSSVSTEGMLQRTLSPDCLIGDQQWNDTHIRISQER